MRLAVRVLFAVSSTIISDFVTPRTGIAANVLSEAPHRFQISRDFADIWILV